MNTKELAALLDGREAGKELTTDESKAAADDGLVILFGYSDDDIYVAGASEGEVYAFGGGADLLFNSKGLVANRCTDEDCPYHADEQKNVVTIHGEYKEEDGHAIWRFTSPDASELNGETFIIYENGDTFCQGIVFALADVDRICRMKRGELVQFEGRRCDIHAIKVTPVGAQGPVTVNVEMVGANATPSLYPMDLISGFREYAHHAGKTAMYPNRGTTPFYPALGLAGEAGEVANKIKKMMRDGKTVDELRDTIRDELGDVLWYVAALCHEFGIRMDYVASHNVAKLAARAEAGTIKGDGDKR